jgi:hypothetical protein
MSRSSGRIGNVLQAYRPLAGSGLATSTALVMPHVGQQQLLTIGDMRSNVTVHRARQCASRWMQSQASGHLFVSRCRRGTAGACRQHSARKPTTTGAHHVSASASSASANADTFHPDLAFRGLHKFVRALACCVLKSEQCRAAEAGVPGLSCELGEHDASSEGMPAL